MVNNKPSYQWLHALLLMLGASFLLFRTVRMMLVENAFELLVPWVSTLLVFEFMIDLSCIIGCIYWLVHNNLKKAKLALRLAAAATIVHAIRVFVFVLGRTGPWTNFDVKPEHHDTYSFTWFWVYFAAALSILGVIGVIVIWQIIRHKQTITKE